ncbi:MAG: hypothetical protein N3G74_01505 [Candidatus Micrarchaeota archaeon]|nr:hypothetical protein [Candidatus Micrarchaeota archaeon]
MPNVERIKIKNEINFSKKIDVEKSMSRLREAEKRLQRCRFRWQKREALKLIESVIKQPELDDKVYIKAKDVLTRFLENGSDTISFGCKNLLCELEKKKQMKKE